MTKDIGRISELKIAIDSLDVIHKAIITIQKETGENYFLNPNRVITKAKEKLEQLKKL